MRRLFLALPIPPRYRDLLESVQAGAEGVRWVRAENLHVTIRFLGDVDGATAEDLDGLLARLDLPAVPVTVTGVGQFGPKKRPTSLWAGIEALDAVRHLHGKVERACTAAGLEPDGRRFHPHVTLGRMGGPSQVGGWIAQHAGFGLPPWDARELVMYESHLHRDGAIYSPLAEYPLGAESAWLDDVES